MIKVVDTVRTYEVAMYNRIHDSVNTDLAVQCTRVQGQGACRTVCCISRARNQYTVGVP